MGGCQAVQTLFRLLFQSELNYTAVCMCDFADIRTIIWHDSVGRISYMSVTALVWWTISLLINGNIRIKYFFMKIYKD